MSETVKRKPVRKPVAQEELKNTPTTKKPEGDTMPEIKTPTKKPVKKPTMEKHAETEATEAAKVKTDANKKPTRKQVKDAQKLQLAKLSEANPVGATTALNAYINFFQLNEAEDFMTMVQEIDEENSTIVLKHGYTLPVTFPATDDDLMEFITITSAMMNPDDSPMVNMVNFRNENPDFDTRTVAFFYLLIELLGLGRKAPNTDWSEIESTPCAVEDITDFNQVFEVMDAYVENPIDGAAEFKGLLEALAPEAFAVFHPLFNRDSFKKLGLTISSYIEGEDAVFTSDIASLVSYIVFDLYGSHAPEDETEDEEEAEEESPKPQADSKKTTAKQKAEPTEKLVDEDEEPEIEEDEDDIYDEEDEDDIYDEEDEEDEEA